MFISLLIDAGFVGFFYFKKKGNFVLIMNALVYKLLIPYN